MVKRILSTLVLILSWLYANAATTVNVDGRWNGLVRAIGYVESRHNPQAVSKNGLYVGYLQISTTVVDDCNRIVGWRKYRYSHRYDKDCSIEMFYVMQSYYNPCDNVERAIRLWNGGPNYSVRKTENYFQEVYRLYSKIGNA